MKTRIAVAMLLAASLVCAGVGRAADTNPQDYLPEKTPFDMPYGPPISLAKAQGLVQAAITEATKRGWAINVAVADSGTNLVAFARMDQSLLAATAVSQHKARAAVKFRRPTRFYEDALFKQNVIAILTLDDVIATRGGYPLIEDGKVIGGIGCSGGSSAQDDTICAAAVAAFDK